MIVTSETGDNIGHSARLRRPSSARPRRILNARPRRIFTARLRRPFTSESGQSLLELALLTPLLLLILIGVVEMGRYAYLSILLGNAAESGTLYGAQSLTDSVDTTGIQNAVQNDFQNGQGLTGLTVTSATSCGCDSGGATVTNSCSGTTAGTCIAGHWVVMLQVTVSGTFTSLFQYPGIPQTVTVTRTVGMRVKQQ